MNFIDRIFVGELTSTVMCEECENVGILELGLMWNRSHTGLITLSWKYKIVLPILYLFVCLSKQDFIESLSFKMIYSFFKALSSQT